ncbi:MAG: DUF4394 domain-containing protein [Candidatus Sumerlaeaceae bacterium]
MLSKKTRSGLLHVLVLTGGLLSITPEANALAIYAITGSNELYIFDHTAPGVSLYSSIPDQGFIPIVGLQPGEALVGIDFRPSTGELYGIGNTSRLYKINVQLVTPPATALAIAVSSTPFPVLLSGTRFGVDFNPVVDRVRVVSNAEQNLRINPFTGTLAANDAAINPAGNLVEVAYDRSFAGTTSTTLFALDSTSNQLMRIGSVNQSPISPNTGTTTAIGPLGVDFISQAALDFAGPTLFAILRVGTATHLYTVNTATGAATVSGATVLDNPLIIGMAVAPQLAAISKKSIKLNFAKTDSDSISVTGALQLPTGFLFTAANQTAVLNIGGITRTFLLDEKGKAKIGFDSLAVTVKEKNGVRTATFKASLKKGNFAASLVDEGLVNADLSDVPVQVEVSLYVTNTYFHGSESLPWTYDGKAGKSGKAK